MLRRTMIIALVLALGAVYFPPNLASAGPKPGESELLQPWSRWDSVVQFGLVQRTWTFGPLNANGFRSEPYADTPAFQPYNAEGWRLVHYFDKARVELDPTSNDPLWRFTTGLLATELITGQMQLGDTLFEQHEPSHALVAGDPDSTITPTYATLQPLLGMTAQPAGALVTQTLAADGTTGDDPVLAENGVAAIDVGAPTSHSVASVFWTFMNSSGLVVSEEGGAFVEERLFPNAFYATGYPITEAYWTQAQVAGTAKDVLLQCFERRCLTYTPDNPAAWRVEFGNIGQHYFAWRYPGEEFPPPTPIS